MTPEAERFNGWAAMLGFVPLKGDILEKSRAAVERIGK